MNKTGEHHVEFLEAGEDATKAFQTAKQPLDFVSPFVNRFAVVPGGYTGRLGRHDRNKSQIQRQLPGFVALVSAVHDQVQAPVRWTQRDEQFAPLGRIARGVHCVPPQCLGGTVASFSYLQREVAGYRSRSLPHRPKLGR